MHREQQEYEEEEEAEKGAEQAGAPLAAAARDDQPIWLTWSSTRLAVSSKMACQPR